MKYYVRVVDVGDKIEWYAPEERKPDEGLMLEVLYEDEHMAVVLKPPGVKVHGRGDTAEVNSRGRHRPRKSLQASHRYLLPHMR